MDTSLDFLLSFLVLFSDY